MKHGDAVLLDPLIQAGCTLDGQGMNGQAVRCQFHDPFDCTLYIRLQFPRQSQDQIHINIVEADLSRQPICRKYLFHAGLSADDIQCLLLHSLGIHGDAADLMTIQYLQLLSGDAVGTTGFHSEFLHGREIKLGL